MSPSGAVTIAAKAGDVVCRPAGWIDVVKFFLLNYGLHAFTVISTPGSTTLSTMATVFYALILPCSGVVVALNHILRFPLRESDPLKSAHRARALCMILPASSTRISELETITPETNLVHGQHPLQDPNDPRLAKFLARLLKSLRAHIPFSKKTNNDSGYRMVVVPMKCSVRPLPELGTASPQLACNYSLLKAVAAVLQILYASLELYQARGRQFERFGYSAYSLTVIPYILMSLANLVATACGSQYPSMFIVLCRGDRSEFTTPGTVPTGSRVVSEPRGSKQEISNQEEQVDDGRVWQEIEAKISGAVGEAFWEDMSQANSNRTDMTANNPSSFGRLLFRSVKILAGALITICVLAAPFIIIALLTGFKNGQSTRSQRSWVMVWLVLGQYLGGSYEYFLHIALNDYNPSDVQRIKFVCTVFVSVVAIGGFVVVAKMLIHDQICTIV